MSCRSTPGMSVPIALAHRDSGLDDDQVQSLLHQIRHEFAETHPAAEVGDQTHTAEATRERWNEFRERMVSHVNGDPTLRPQRRAGMIQRLTQAEAAPPADMVYAAAMIRERAIRSARQLDAHLATEAARIGVPDAEARATYDEGRSNAPRGRQPRPTDDERRQWRGLPLDPGTRSALHALADRPDNPDGRHDLITTHPAPTGEGTSDRVRGIGFHPDSGRLEVITPDGAMLAYRDVSQNVVDDLNRDPGTTLDQQLMGNVAHQYRDPAEAVAAGIRRRCSSCGRFTGARHTCVGRRGGTDIAELGAIHPLPAAPTETLVLSNPQHTEIQTHPIAQIVGALEERRGDNFQFPVSSDTVRGGLIASQDAEGDISVVSAYLSCTCRSWSIDNGCEHTSALTGDLRAHLVTAVAEHRDQVAAATAAAIAPSPATTRPAQESLLPDAPNLSTFSYTDDPARFTATVRDIWAAEERGEEPVPLIIGTADSPAMYGFGADRQFGVEIEFDRSAIQTADLVGAELYRQEFTRSPRQTGYHSAARGGYSESLTRGWTFEHDASVTGGELVTPVMRDTPQTWERLQQACRIITDNGGLASRNTGSHITIGAPEQAGQAARMTRFLRHFHHHQADLHVMAAAGRGRGQGYAQYMPAPPLEGYTRMGSLPNERYQFVNLAHVARRSTDSGASSSRIEFRLWDGSVQAGRIQAQVRMSAAMLDYATHNRDLAFNADQRAGGSNLNPDHADFADRTAQVRHLIDSMFRRDEDKAQAAALWAAGLRARNGRRSHFG